MKRTFFVIFNFLFISTCLLAQKPEAVIVKAGTNLNGYFPMKERYLYPEFTQGKGFFQNNRIVPCLFNFNLLSGEIEFISSKDTLLIAKKQEIVSIVVAQDTFYYHESYLQLIQNGPLKLFLKRGLKIQDIRKEGAMGSVNRSAASDSYSFLILGKRTLDLKPTEDILLQKTEEYCYSLDGVDYIPFTRKNILKVRQVKEEVVKDFIKSNKIDFESREDMIRLTDYVNMLLSGNVGKP
jgi:hypothetical protein